MQDSKGETDEINCAIEVIEDELEILSKQPIKNEKRIDELKSRMYNYMAYRGF